MVVTFQILQGQTSACSQKQTTFWFLAWFCTSKDYSNSPSANKCKDEPIEEIHIVIMYYRILE